MKCAVITPVGPGHEATYRACRSSIDKAWAHGQGPFDALEIIPMWDLEGAHGRSARRNEGIDEAIRRECDWIFFLDADDLMDVGVFVSFAEHADELDAIWGNICESNIDESDVHLRPNQIESATTIEEILLTHPFLSLQMGHFVRSACAAAVKFDVSMDTGEDFKYYLEIWSRFRCAKVPAVFFINRRGRHSTGPRSADGGQWTKVVQNQILECCAKYELSSTVRLNGKEACFAINNPFDLIQQHHMAGIFFEMKELKSLTRVVGPERSIVEVGANVGNHLVYYAQHMRAKKIFPIEPNPDAISLLNRNIKSNNLERLIDERGIGIGAGAEYGKFSVVLPGENNLGAAQLEPGSGDLEVYPLDKILGDEKVDFMKIDVEGMEFEVLEGAKNVIHRNRPIMLIEVFRTSIGKFEEWCGNNGYNIVKTFNAVHAANFLVRPAA